MIRRYWALLQSVGIGLLVAGVVAFGLVVTAGAGASTACSASGDQCLTAAQSVGTVAAGAPFSSGQDINIVIPANNTFSSTDGLGNNNSNINILECAAPNGVIPTQTAACDGNTIQGPTVIPNPDGSFTLTGYTVFALPDSVLLSEGSGGPVCGNTLATECILYIGNDQGDFTQPHLWSQGFFINPATGSDNSDTGVNPGDGSAAATATTPTAANSTVVPSPATLPADGVNSSTVTVTLEDAANTPVSGKAVTLSPSCTPMPCSTHITGPSSAQTDTNGQTTFTVTDTAAQSVSLTATDTTDSAPLTPATVTFQAPTTSAANSTVIASPTNPPADGSAQTTVTVTLRDQGIVPQPIVGDTVTLADGSGHAVITPAAIPDKTDASGVATFTATDNTAETVQFTATDTTASNTVITNKASVTFGTLAVSATQSTVTAPTPAPLGSLGTEAVVTLLTSGSSPVPGKAVNLQASGSASVGAATPATTGANGQVSFKVTDLVAETVTLTATDTTDGVAITQTTQVVFAQPTASPTVSNVLASNTTSPADGETQTLIRVILSDQFGNPLQGKTANLQGSPSGNVQIHPVAVGGTGTPGVSNAAGEVDFNADDTVAENVTFTAIDTSDNVTLTKTVSVAYTAGPADPASIGTTVTANPTNPPADGSTPSTITVTLTDFFSNPVAGKTIALKALNGSSTISPASAVTDQNGQAQFAVKDSTAEVVTYQATDTTDGNAVIDAEAVVKFGNPPVPPPDATFCSVSANPTSVPADGSRTVTISVLLYDDNGDPVAGKTVALSAASGSPQVTATNATSNNSGMATFAVTDTTAESVRFSATDTTDNIPLTDPVTVTFTAAAPADSTTTTTTTTSPTGGTTTTTAAPTATVTGSSTGGTVGNTGAGSSSPTLAATGAGMVLPWLVAFGVLFLVAGTVGRRRFRRYQQTETADNLHD